MSTASERNLGDMISSHELASLLNVTPEYARRLIVASRAGNKNHFGHWRISRSWADKFERLRSVHRVNDGIDVDAYEIAYSKRTSVRLTGADGVVELCQLSEAELTKLEFIFGPLPIVLADEEESVLRTRESMNHKRRDVRTSWTDLWADRIKKCGRLILSRETSFE